MKRLAIVAVVVVASPLPWATGPAQARPAPAACTAAWSKIDSPNPASDNNALFDVHVRTEADAWAVGDKGPFTNTKTLVERWNGQRWRAVPSPNRTNSDNSLFGISASSATRAIAVGTQTLHNPNRDTRTLVMLWNGTNWSLMTSPNPGPFENRLQDVVMLSATNAWAVGRFTSPNGTKSLIIHYDGNEWTKVNSPSEGTHTELFGIDAVNEDDIWAVGGSFSTAAGQRTFILHYDGDRWSKFEHTRVQDRELNAVSALPNGRAWAVGGPHGISDGRTLAMRFQSGTWSAVGSVTPPGGFGLLHGVHAVSTTQILAAGVAGETLVERSTGGGFTRMAAPKPGGLQGISAAGDRQFAVGIVGTDTGSNTLILQRCI